MFFLKSEIPWVVYYSAECSCDNFFQIYPHISEIDENLKSFS